MANWETLPIVLSCLLELKVMWLSRYTVDFKLTCGKMDKHSSMPTFKFDDDSTQPWGTLLTSLFCLELGFLTPTTIFR